MKTWSFATIDPISPYYSIDVRDDTGHLDSAASNNWQALLAWVAEKHPDARTTENIAA